MGPYTGMNLLWALVTLVALGARAEELPWYHQAIVYQLYPRSFQDTNGDGIGDLKGILQHVDYLESLGIDAVWLSPVYPSPNRDFGYDVSDFRGIHKDYGTMEDFDNLMKALKERGIRVIMDFVPNHSSDQHEWFQKSANGDPKYKEYYVWRDQKKVGDKLVPFNNWTSQFGGSMWKYHDGRKQTYLHQYLDGQPDLNYQSEDVQREMEEVLRFWMEKGVSGFRMDSVFTIAEDESLADETYTGGDPNSHDSYIHDKTTEQPLTYQVLRKFKEVMENYTKETKTEPKLMMTESWSNDPKVLQRYYGSKDAPVTTFPFNFLCIMRMGSTSSAQDWANSINTWYNPSKPDESVMPDSWAQPNFVLGNHDQHRFASRFSPEYTDVLNMVQLTLKGTAVTYYGDELGLVDSAVRRDQGQDIQGLIAPPGQFYARSRDPERAPMPWNGSSNGGFTTGKPWLPLAGDYVIKNVETQKRDELSHLNVFKSLSALRKKFRTLREGTNEVTHLGNSLIVFRTLADHPSIITIVNLSNAQERVNLLAYRPSLPEHLKVLVKSVNFSPKDDKTVSTSQIILPPLSGLVVGTF